MDIHKQIQILKLTHPNTPHDVLAFAAGLQAAFDRVSPEKRYSPEAIIKAITLALECYEETHKK